MSSIAAVLDYNRAVCPVLSQQGLCYRNFQPAQISDNSSAYLAGRKYSSSGKVLAAVI